MRWKPEVPMLEGSDFCRNHYANGECRCLLGWVYDVFGGSPWPYSVSFDARHAMFSHVVPEIRKSLAELGATSDTGFDSLDEVNDDGRNPLPLLARAWNRGMGRLGYVVGNPECDRRGRLRPVKG